MSIAQSNFIERYLSLVKEYSDVPYIFARASAYHIISTLLGQYVRCPLLPSALNKPRVWFIISSLPGLMRRSTIHDLDKLVIKSALQEFYNLKGDKRSEEDIQKDIQDMFIETGSSEGIIDHIENTKLSVYTLMSAEFGVTLDEMRTKDYQSGVTGLLNKLYYGEEGSVYLSQRGGKKGERRIPPNIYATMFASMQEADQYLNDRIIKSGLIRRIMICYVSKDDLKDDEWKEPLPKDDTSRDRIRENLMSLGKEIAPLMVELDKMREPTTNSSIDTILPDQVRVAINEYAKKVEFRARKDPNNVNLYEQTFWEHLTSLMILEALSKGIISKQQRLLRVSQDDLARASEFLDRIEVGAKNIIEKIGVKKEPARTYEEPIERVYRIILEAGSKGIERTTLNNKCKLYKDERNKIIEELEDEGRIIEVLGPPTGGRRSIIYKVTSYSTQDKKF